MSTALPSNEKEIIVATTLKLQRKLAVGFIEWLGVLRWITLDSNRPLKRQAKMSVKLKRRFPRADTDPSDNPLSFESCCFCE